MDVPSSIALVLTYLDTKLTDEQRRQVREKLTDNAALCKELTARLAPERGDAAEHGPVVTNFDELMALIDDLVDEQWKPRPLVPALVAIGALVVVGVIVLIVNLQPDAGTSEDDIAATNPADRSGRTATTGQATTGPTTQPTALNGTATTSPATATTNPAERVWPVTAGPMTWEEFLLPIMYQPTSDLGQTSGLFLNSDGKDTVTAKSKRDIRLQGTYRLGILPAAGKMIRLGLYDAQEFSLTFWSGDRGVRIEIDGSQWVIRAQGLARSGKGGAETIADTYIDGGVWMWYGRGAIDVRYQDAQVLVCRGEIPMIRIPLAAPPVSGSVKAKSVRLWQGEARPCRPLPLPAGPAANEEPVERIMPGTLTWTAAPSGKAALEIDPNTRVVSLSATDQQDEGQAYCELDIPPLTGLEATVHVRRAAAPASVFARVGDSYYQMQLHSHKGQRVVDPGDRATMDEDVRVGRVVGEQFWVRFRCGIDTIMAWTSADGKTWWPRRSQALSGKIGTLQLGLFAHRDKAAHGIAMGEITIRRYDTIPRMIGVDAALVAKAAAAMSNNVAYATTRGQALAIMDSAREQGVDPDRWRTACDVNLATTSRNAKVRGEAMRTLLLAHCSQGTDEEIAAVLDAVEELQDLANSGDMASMLDEVFSALGRLCLEAGRTEMLKTVMDASYRRPRSAGSPWSGSLGGVSVDLLRMVLLDGMTRGEWESVRYEALRAMYMASGRDRRDWPILAKWAADEADIRLSADSPASGTWRHPLMVGSYPAVMNVLGEFMFLMKGEHHAEACKTITSRTLPDMLVSLDQGGEVLQSSHFMIREMIRTTPQLRELLGQKAYVNIGMIRLERARKQNDLHTLRSLAAQFHGTAAGLGAMHVLADRDLSNGNFSAAASRYGALRGEARYANRAEAAAKFRLASAMMGQLAGQPVTQSVALSGQTLSADQFERMVKQLAADRKSDSGAEGARTEAIAPGPTDGVARLTPLADVPGKDVRARRRNLPPTVFAIDGDRLYVSHADRFFAVNCASKEVLWAHVPEAEPKRANTPRSHAGEDTVRILRMGGRLYLRTGLEGRPLACFDAKTGKQLWRRQYDHRVLSDPIMIGSSVCVISARHDASDALFLHRVFPDSGESSLSHRLVHVRDEWPTVGRPVVVGDAMIFRTAGCLINCDVRGAIRWARRLPFVPPAALPELHTDVALDDIIVWQDKNIIFTAPGCPSITCVDAAGGKVIWTQMIHSATRLVGPVGGNVVAVESGRLRGLDAATGKIRWTHVLTDPAGEARVLPGANETLALVRLAKDPSKRLGSAGRYVRWISAVDGKTVKEIQIEGDSSLHDVQTLFADSTRIFGLSNFVQYRPGQGKIFMIEIEAKED